MYILNKWLDMEQIQNEMKEGMDGLNKTFQQKMEEVKEQINTGMLHGI